MNSPKDAGFLFIHAYVFLQIQRESFSIFVGLISDSRLFEWLVLPIYNRYPISDLFLYPSHTVLSLLYSAISCEGCERRVLYWYFWLDPKVPKTQDRIRSFALMQKNQKIKAASAELLRHFVTLCAPQTRFAQTATLRPLHFVPPLNAHQNEAGPSIDN